jgi:phosphoribosylamine---glycine ligase
MRVLLLGSGGRESALAWSLDRSPSVSELVVAPGNPGMTSFATRLDVDPASPEKVVALCGELRPDLVVVGPEGPLVAGVGDALRDSGVRVFGPNAAAARIEGSKTHAKDLMARAGIPTARATSFTTVPDAVAFMDELGPPFVVKADGLAAGKGVVVTEDRSEAITALEDRLVRHNFGVAGHRVVIEEYLDGQELSLIAFSDGKTVLACEPAQDYKRVGDGDTGPNTGGMGSYSPVPACSPQLAEQIISEVIEPMVAAAASSGDPFVGALYAGLALTSRGPKVIEFNVRFGDPETQALMPRLRSDFGEVCFAAASGELAGMRLDWTPEVCVSVVLAADGYPGDYSTGVPILGIDDASSLKGVNIFHAGTAIEKGILLTSGGRVLALSALGASFKEARSRAYDAARSIDFYGKHFRSDIALRAESSEHSV